MKSGSRPGAPLGGQSTKVLPLPEDPVAVAAPAVLAPPLVRAPPRVPLPEKPPPPPLPLLVVVPVPAAPAELVEIVEPVGFDADAEAVVPGRGVPAVAVAPELPIAGRATAPPDAGKPPRWAALPTAPVVGVALGAVV
jgi:hypothetical protein